METDHSTLFFVYFCAQDAIGWRKAARHLVIFSTDASFHYAGDGKLGGIVKPNDGSCHLMNNEYTMATELVF